MARPMRSACQKRKGVIQKSAAEARSPPSPPTTAPMRVRFVLKEKVFCPIKELAIVAQRSEMKRTARKKSIMSGPDEL